MRLASIRISNFKGFRSETFEPCRFSCLVGENNAGKSTVLQATVAGLKRPPQLDAELYYNQAQPIELRMEYRDIGEADLARLADDASYCDPNGLIEGRAELSAYMGGFQQNVPGASFRIRSVLHHHDRSLANWSMIGAGGEVMQDGTSFGLPATDGRLRRISGFFYETGEDQTS